MITVNIIIPGVPYANYQYTIVYILYTWNDTKKSARRKNGLLKNPAAGYRQDFDNEYGKIFISHVENVYRVCTKESGESAI